MAFTATLADLHTETSCPICLEYLKDPVTLRCGHNFCLSCISVSWKDLKDTFPCLFCHVNSSERKFTSNDQLANLTEITKLLPIRRNKRKREEKKFVCKEHKQVLAFCQEDLEILCPHCPLSTEHQLHCVWPIPQAALHHRKRVEQYNEPWKGRMEEVEKLMTLQSRKSLEVKKRVKRRREEVNSEFEELTLFFQNEQETILTQFQDEEMDISAQLNESLTKFSAHASSLKDLLKEIESKCVKSELKLVEDVKNICHTYRNLKHPDTFSFKFQDYCYRSPPQYSGLNIIIQRFQANVLLDPETAYCKLVISENKKAVIYGNMKKVLQNPRRFYVCPAVVGSESYHSGRQFWAVEVQDKPEWILGVCRESLPRRKKKQVQPSLVQYGLWGIGHEKEANYFALGSKKMYLLPKVMPSKIGIFLDLEVGEISFYNLDDRTLLYTFNDCFTEALYPYFYIGTDSKPLRICTVTDSE